MTPLPPRPLGAAYWLRRSRLPLTFLARRERLAAGADSEGSALVDLKIADGRIAAIVPAGAQAGATPEFDLDGGMIWPSPVELHTHLDKGHIWARAENPDGTFAAALATVGADRGTRWTAADVRARMSFSLAAAYAHGTRAIRTHLDSLAPQGGITWPVFAALREEWASRITLQGVSLVPIDFFRDAAAGEALARLVAAHRGILRAVTYMTPDLLPQRPGSLLRLRPPRRRRGLHHGFPARASRPAGRCLAAHRDHGSGGHHGACRCGRARDRRGGRPHPLPRAILARAAVPPAERSRRAARRRRHRCDAAGLSRAGSLALSVETGCPGFLR